jgi:hypothetical protein
MKKMQSTATWIVAAVAVGISAAEGAHAGVLPPGSDIPLSYTEYQSGTVGPGTESMLTTPGAYGYMDLNLQPESSTGEAITGSGASFYDAFLIDITGSQASSISSTINLGSLYQITDFQERLYPYIGTAPTVGAVTGAIDFWTTAIDLGGNAGTVAELPTKTLMPGEYVLEMRGDVTGSTGGAFSGTLQLSPVPLPETLPLLLSGLGVLGAALLRRRNSL